MIKLIKQFFLFIIFAAFFINSVGADFTNSPTTNSYYDRNKAYDYISKYVINPNPAYADFTELGGDCTNFVSQVLRAGGMAFTSTSKNPTYKQWYYYNSTLGTGRSSTWTGSNEFRQHWAEVKGVGYKRAYKYTKYTVNEALTNFDSIRTSVWAGDVIQHLNGYDGKTYHSQAIFSFSNSDIIVGQHTYNMVRSLKNYLKAKQDSGFGNDGVCIINIKHGS